MIKQIIDALEVYKVAKEKNDSWEAESIKLTRETFMPEIARPRIEAAQKHHLEVENKIKAQTRARVQYEINKVSKWVDFMIQDIHAENLAEIKALDGMNFSEIEMKALVEKYKGDHFSMRLLSDMFNEKLPELAKINYVSPEMLLQYAEELQQEANALIDNFHTGNLGVAEIRSQLAEKSIYEMAEKFKVGYISGEEAFDAPTPLTSAEKKEVEAIFAGIAPHAVYQMEFAARKAAEQGKGGLIARSEYAKYLGDFDVQAHEITAISEKFLSSSALMLGEEIKDETAGSMPKVAAILGMGAENAQETPVESAEVQE